MTADLGATASELSGQRRAAMTSQSLRLSRFRGRNHAGLLPSISSTTKSGHHDSEAHAIVAPAVRGHPVRTPLEPLIEDRPRTRAPG